MRSGANFGKSTICFLRRTLLYRAPGSRATAFSILIPACDRFLSLATKMKQSITRRHFIREHPRLPNLLSIVGGKLTTYRSLAEECVDLIFRKLGKDPPPCRTAVKSLEFKL